MFDLFVTWEGPVGQGIAYIVEYRPYPQGGSWTVLPGTFTNTYATIPNLPIQFYEIRVKTDCDDEDSAYIYQIAGKEPCPIVEYIGYSIVEENSNFQVLSINYGNYTQTVRTVITNLNNNTVILNNIIPANGNLSVTLPKVAGQNTTYRVEISNICQDVVETPILMGDYTVVGPPALITTSFRMTQDFKTSNNCTPPNVGPNKPDTGTSIKFSEPLPQDVTITFDYCRRCVFSSTTICESDNSIVPRYFRITIPAGTTTWRAGHFRECDVTPGTASVCIISIVPEILNNGKKLSFSDATFCTVIKPVSIANLNQWPWLPNPPCIT